MSFPSTLLLAAVTALGLTACGEPSANAPGRSANDNVPRVITAVARVEQMGVEIEAVGTAQAKESVQITSKVSNTVTAISFKEGEEVAEGSVLVEMHDVESRAAVAEAEAALARSRSQFDRSRDLQKRQALSVADFEQVDATLKADEARLAAAKSRLADTVLRAPFRGTTGFRNISVGAYVSPGTVITTLDDTSRIKLDFTVPETMLFIVRRGLPVAARATGLPDRVFTGVVTNMDSRVDPVTRSIAVRAELPNTDGMLRQGMFLTVALKAEASPTLLVPEEAIVPERGKAYVFVVQDNVVQRREVRTGKRKPGSVEIIDGLHENEHVVVEGTQNIRDGSTVQEMPPPNSPS
ncbi:MAG: efflux RND transporter periplasmic adaptor subunit [Gammaproteobacteria bacterium]